jgi:hypothetical protein
MRAEEAGARVKAEIAARLAMAPTRADLPALQEEPVDRVFLMDGVGDWRPGYAVSGRVPAEETGGDTVAPRPDRISYSAGYGSPTTAMTTVMVVVTQYPNVAWAKYDVLNNPGSVDIHSVSQFGHRIYQNGAYFSWASGTKLVRLDLHGVSQPVIDEFLKAYLAKYPSEF